MGARHGCFLGLNGLFCFVSRVVFAFGWRASSGTTGSLRTEASNHVRFRWLVIMNPIVCGEWQEITYSSGATICSPWMSLTGSSNSEAFTDRPARCAKLEGPKELLDAISLCYELDSNCLKWKSSEGSSYTNSQQAFLRFKLHPPDSRDVCEVTLSIDFWHAEILTLAISGRPSSQVRKIGRTERIAG